MPETTVYILRGQAGINDNLRRIREQSGDYYADAVTAVLRAFRSYMRPPLGSLMRELHARGRLDGYRVRRG